tara:strand:- start:4308 stop:4517 length:210 start_codon:yes stop_codon:yes gene_type:complete
LQALHFNIPKDEQGDLFENDEEEEKKPAMKVEEMLAEVLKKISSMEAFLSMKKEEKTDSESAEDMEEVY